VFDTRELGRRPGALRRLSRTVPVPPSFGNEVIGVPEGAELAVEFRMESVMEGVLVTGTVRAPLAGECVRCLEPLDREVTADYQELFAYPDTLAGVPGRGQDGAADEEADEETQVLQDDMVDLEPVLRDAVVLSLPLQPVCREDCPGLCPECGARLADDPEHHHEEAVDIRWAALRELAGTLESRDGAARQEKAPRGSGDDDPQEK
jgi:uncharacterized protein